MTILKWLNKSSRKKIAFKFYRTSSGPSFIFKWNSSSAWKGKSKSWKKSIEKVFLSETLITKFKIRIEQKIRQKCSHKDQFHDFPHFFCWKFYLALLLCHDNDKLTKSSLQKTQVVKIDKKAFWVERQMQQ